MSTLIRTLAGLFFLLPLIVCAEAISVGVSVPPQKYLVERIGGPHVSVFVMLRPGDSPENFDPGPAQIQTLNRAALYFPVGLEFEKKWLAGLSREDHGVHIIECCQAITAGQDSKLDQHVWISVRNARLLAGQIKTALLELDPANATDYEKNYLALTGELAELDIEITQSLETRRTDFFIVAHAALGHFAADYGLVQLALEEGGKELGAKSLVRLARKARSENIQMLFVQQQHPSNSALTLARELNAELVEINPMPDDYLSGLREIARLLAMATR